MVNRTDEIKDEDIGLGCGLFEIRKFGDECVSSDSHDSCCTYYCDIYITLFFD